MLANLIEGLRNNARKNRGKLFFQYIDLDKEQAVLDFGGADGTHINSILGKNHANVCIADINRKKLEKAKKDYGYETIFLDESGDIPGFWDVIFCSSVIEHVTVDKDQIYKITSTQKFSDLSLERQKKLANEIRAKCKRYFVQTPYKYFLVESHTWLPGIFVFLPRKLQIKVIKLSNKLWIKRTSPDFHLLTIRKMKELFPDAEIIREKKFGFTKSIIAVRR